jgi:hypothetical protein
MEPEKITIETLRQLTSKSQLTFESILKRCENEAKNGKNEAQFIEFFPPLLIGELLSSGFKINQSRNHFLEQVTCISW